MALSNMFDEDAPRGRFEYIRDLPTISAANCFCGPDELIMDRPFIYAYNRTDPKPPQPHRWPAKPTHPELPTPFVTKQTMWQRIRGKKP